MATQCVEAVFLVRIITERSSRSSESPVQEKVGDSEFPCATPSGSLPVLLVRDGGLDRADPPSGR